MPAQEPPPELRPFIDALAELLASQVIKDLQRPAEGASPPHVSDARTPSNRGLSG